MDAIDFLAVLLMVAIAIGLIAVSQWMHYSRKYHDLALRVIRANRKDLIYPNIYRENEP